MARKEKTLVDEHGREYPVKILDPNIISRDRIVSRAMGRALKLHDRIEKEKQKMVAEIEAYLTELAEQYGESWKGNTELLSFDGQYKIEIRYREHIQFGAELQIAKQKIDNCLTRWSKDTNINLQSIIKEAFQVDTKGLIAKSKILGLRKYKIKDEEWEKAMNLIDEAIQVTSTKQYIAFYQRPAPNKQFKLVTLNFSAI